MACMMRVLDIGPIDEIDKGAYETKAYSEADKKDIVRQVKNMANPELTNPSIRFVAHEQGKVR